MCLVLVGRTAHLVNAETWDYHPRGLRLEVSRTGAGEGLLSAVSPLELDVSSNGPEHTLLVLAVLVPELYFVVPLLGGVRWSVPQYVCHGLTHLCSQESLLVAAARG